MTVSPIVESKRACERWLRQLPLVAAADLARKSEKLAKSAFALLRGTFFRQTGVAAAVRAAHRCPLATCSGVIDLGGSSRGLTPAASTLNASGIHLQQRGTAVLRHR